MYSASYEVSAINELAEDEQEQADEEDAETQFGDVTKDYTYRPDSDKEFSLQERVPVTAVIDMTSEFSDVSSDAWSADGVSWASANGIANGYDNGQFGPDDNVTREQFAVMRWKYAGSPEASGKLDFTDTDQASSYALEALSWAVENGILNGYGNGQLDPGGIATRAQAAQMLKNFMENT